MSRLLGVTIRAPKLQAKREQCGLTRRELALMIGITPTELGVVEAGGPVPGEEFRTRVLRALHAGFDEVFALEWVDRFGRRHRE